MNEDNSEDRQFLLSIRPQNILSFGPETLPLRLRPLNVLIGPNGAGKSNLIEIIALMRATPIPETSPNADLRGVVRRGGGVAEWIWKGRKDEPASVELLMKNPKGHDLLHKLAFREDEQGFRLNHEEILNEPSLEKGHGIYPVYKFYHGVAWAYASDKAYGKKQFKLLRIKDIHPDLSILAQRQDPDRYPEMHHLAENYGQVRIYREWGFGRNAVFRRRQRTDMRLGRLEEDFSNLALFLSRLCKRPQAKADLLEALRDLYEGVTDFGVDIVEGTVQVFFTEGDFTIPATRLSDGTLRYLCLMAILCDPDPPPLICIEEPELGLHPDILPNLADKLVSASEKTQLIVTTHSDILVDAMTERPEAVVVCEKHEGQTTMRRLNKEKLAVWLDKYRLGELWIRGQLGGKRW